MLPLNVYIWKILNSVKWFIMCLIIGLKVFLKKKERNDKQFTDFHLLYLGALLNIINCIKYKP